MDRERETGEITRDVVGVQLKEGGEGGEGGGTSDVLEIFPDVTAFREM